MTTIPGGFRVENIAPILNVKDMDRSLSFYVDLLGFKKADWGDDTFTSVNRDNAGLYLCIGGQGCVGTWIWIGFDGDIFSLHEKLRSKGVIIKLPPTNFPWAYEMRWKTLTGTLYDSEKSLMTKFLLPHFQSKTVSNRYTVGVNVASS